MMGIIKNFGVGIKASLVLLLASLVIGLVLFPLTLVGSRIILLILGVVLGFVINGWFLIKFKKWIFK